jgi:glycosyltransferase involved in cell wall biosynthesis
MRIGIDATLWAHHRGYGRYARELVGAMAPLALRDTLVLFLDDASDSRFTLTGPNIERVPVALTATPTRDAAVGRNRSPWDLLRLTRAVARARVDVFLSPSVYTFFPLPPGLPAVVTIHDAIPERFPAWTLPGWRDRLFWRLKVGLALAQARLILTVSDYAAAQIVDYLDVDPARLRVTLEGVAAAFQPGSEAEAATAAARVGVPPGARWLMYVGGYGPHKHVDLLVRAHAAVAARDPATPLALLLVGSEQDGFHQHAAAIRAAIVEGGAGSLVIWTGFLPDEEVRHLYTGAVALVLPSASEGFGLPAVEAARCGTPVVATRESPLPQLLAGGGIFVPPGDLPALDRALSLMVTDERARLAMGRQALARAERLDWSHAAHVALATLREAAGSVLS